MEKVSLKIYQEETFRHTFAYKDDEGNPVDLTSCTARMEIRTQDNDVLMVLSTANGLITLDTLQGLIKLNVPAANMDASKITWNQAKYDVKVNFPDGTTDTIAFGNVDVLPSVTRV